MRMALPDRITVRGRESTVELPQNHIAALGEVCIDFATAAKRKITQPTSLRSSSRHQ